MVTSTDHACTGGFGAGIGFGWGFSGAGLGRFGSDMFVLLERTRAMFFHEQPDYLFVVVQPLSLFILSPLFTNRTGLLGVGVLHLDMEGIPKLIFVGIDPHLISRLHKKRRGGWVASPSNRSMSTLNKAGFSASRRHCQ